MANIELKPEEALVLIDFLIRFRDKELLTIAHPAEQHALWDLCALLQSQVPELPDPQYAEKLGLARSLIASDNWEWKAFLAAPAIVSGMEREIQDGVELRNEGPELVLIVLCGSIGMFDLVFALNDAERQRYAEEGDSYIQDLAAKVRWRPQDYAARHRS
jgi:hypothetical protein